MTDNGKTRRFQRRALAAEIFLRDEQSDAELVFDSADISPAGLFLRSELLLDEGEDFEVAFKLPGQVHAMRVKGRVVRVDRRPTGDDGQGPGMGIEFVDLSDEELESILEYTRGDGED